MPSEAWGAIGVVLGAIFAYLGVRFSARQTAKAAEEAAAVDSRQVNVEEWRAILSELRAEITRLKSDGKEDRRRIEALERDASSWKARYHAVLLYLRDVLAWARDQLPGSSPPAPPLELENELRF